MKSKLNKILFLVLITTFMVTTFALAQPPFQESMGVEQLTIDFPKFDYTPYKNITYFFNVYSPNGTRVDNSTISCTGQLYSNQFGFLDQENLTYNETTGNFAVDLLKNDLILNEWYHYDMFCQNETIGGFVSASFQTTHQGEQSVPLNDGLFLLPIAMVLLIFVFIKLYTLISEKHEPLRILIIFFIPALLVGTVGYILALSNSFVGSKITLWFYKASNWFSYLFVFYIVIAILVSTLNGLYKLKNAYK